MTCEEKFFYGVELSAHYSVRIECSLEVKWYEMPLSHTADLCAVSSVKSRWSRVLNFKQCGYPQLTAALKVKTELSTLIFRGFWQDQNSESRWRIYEI